MCLGECLCVKLFRRLRGFPRCNGLTTVTDGFCVPEPKFDFLFKRIFLLVKLGYLLFEGFEVIYSRIDVICDLNNLTVCVTVILQQHISHRGCIGFYVALNVIYPKLGYLLLNPLEEVRHKGDVLIAELSA